MIVTANRKQKDHNDGPKLPSCSGLRVLTALQLIQTDSVLIDVDPENTVAAFVVSENSARSRGSVNKMMTMKSTCRIHYGVESGTGSGTGSGAEARTSSTHFDHDCDHDHEMAVVVVFAVAVAVKFDSTTLDLYLTAPTPIGSCLCSCVQ